MKLYFTRPDLFAAQLERALAVGFTVVKSKAEADAFVSDQPVPAVSEKPGFAWPESAPVDGPLIGRFGEWLNMLKENG